MKKQHVIILVAVVAVVCLCICGIGGYLVVQKVGQVANNFMVTDPTKAVEMGQAIADFDLPAGYTPTAMNMMGLATMVMLIPEDNAGVSIVLAQFSTADETQQEQFLKQFEQSMQQSSNSGNLEWKYVEDQAVTLRGQETALKVFEAQDANGTTFRRCQGAFEGKNGVAMLMLMGKTSEWDETLVNDFIDSIK